MLLAIDIGNTLAKFGVFEGEKLFQRISIPTVRAATAEEIYEQIKLPEISVVVVSSVVPALADSYREFSEKYFNLQPIFVDNSFDFNLKIKCRQPENLGVDRLVDAFAAAEKYGAPCVVGDFGTAATIDAVSANREFLGGVIAPGMDTLAEALFLKTSKLPRVRIEKPEKVIGDSTVAAIQSGIFFGYLGFVKEILRRMIDELGGSEKPKIVATGGFARLIANECDLIETVDENLMLDGLRLIYEKSLKL